MKSAAAALIVAFVGLGVPGMLHGAEPGATAAARMILGVPLYAEDTNLGLEFVELLNRHLTKDDIVFVRGQPKLLPLVKAVAGAKIAVIRQSLQTLAEDAVFLKANGVRIDYVCYNPEGWQTSHTPREELDDLPGAMKKARALASSHSAGLIIVPDRNVFALYPGMVREADIFAFQFQRWQHESDAAFAAEVSSVAKQVRGLSAQTTFVAQLAVNPPIGKTAGGEKIYAPVTAATMSAKVNSIRQLVDGVGFLMFGADGGVNRFTAFLDSLQRGP